ACALREKVMGAPISREIATANSSRRASNPSAIRSSSSARSETRVVEKEGKCFNCRGNSQIDIRFGAQGNISSRRFSRWVNDIKPFVTQRLLPFSVDIKFEIVHENSRFMLNAE